MDNKKLDVYIEQIPFGICPKCDSPLMLLRAQYTAYKLARSGWIQAQVDEKSEMKVVCPKCGYTNKVTITDKGITPLGYDTSIDTRKPILKNPIGNKYEAE